MLYTTCIANFDDIFIIGRNLIKMLSRLDTALERLGQAIFKLKQAIAHLKRHQ